MKILAIETSCDETGVAVLEFNLPAGESTAQPKVLLELLSSQVDIHAKTHGIVPEIASRIHSEILPQFLMSVDQKIGLKNIGYIATTTHPGLLGSLLVGNNFARILGNLYHKPLISINHLIGHFYSPFVNLSLSNLEFPALGLIVSGGHTMLILATAKNRFKIIGETRDDAAGEAFDKIARLLGLGYPGGPAINQAAQQVKKSNFKFTPPMLDSHDLDFSFSGLKTQVRQTVEKLTQQGHPEVMPRDLAFRQQTNAHRHSSEILRLLPQNDKQVQSEIAFSAQKAIVESLVEKSFSAVEKFRPKIFILGGGVSANNLLREKLVEKLSILMPKDRIYLPEKKYSTDNAAMIALAAYLSLPENVVAWDKLKTSPSSNL
jgi:N6-L-threonylcarbamoyladenine synthase